MDLLTATPVVLDRGPLASAMRATMSLPLIFPPVLLDGRVLVDGGAMDNVPADVVRAMGASRVVAVNVGDLDDLDKVDYSMFALAGATLDAMMRANTKEAIKQADIIINVPVTGFGSLDWRRSGELIDDGYKAAESMRDRLLPLAVSEAEYARWKAARDGARRTALPIPAFARVEGFSSSDERRLTDLLVRHVGVAFDIDRFQTDLAVLSGLDRYETITWRIVNDAAGASGLLVEGQPKPYGPPFLMLGLNLENTTSEDFRITLTGAVSRLRPRRLRLRAAHRRHARLGSGSGDGALQAAWQRRPFFVSPYAGIVSRTLDVIQDDAIVASYGAALEPGRSGRRRESRTGERSARRRVPRPAQGRCPRSGIRGCPRSTARKRWPRSSGATTRRTARSSRAVAASSTRTCSTSSTVPTSRRRSRAGARAWTSRSSPER